MNSDYLIPCFPWPSSGETTTNLEGSAFTRKTTLPFFLDDQTIAVSYLVNILPGSPI